MNGGYLYALPPLDFLAMGWRPIASHEDEFGLADALAEAHAIVQTHPWWDDSWHPGPWFIRLPNDSIALYAIAVNVSDVTFVWSRVELHWLEEWRALTPTQSALVERAELRRRARREWVPGHRVTPPGPQE